MIKRHAGFLNVQVAFSAFTDFGAVMALAIAVHNIPEVRLRLLTSQCIDIIRTCSHIMFTSRLGGLWHGRVWHVSYNVPFVLRDGGKGLKGLDLRAAVLVVQGVIVAAPVYAATGSRWRAMGIAVASVGALSYSRI